MCTNLDVQSSFPLLFFPVCSVERDGVPLERVEVILIRPGLTTCSKQDCITRYCIYIKTNEYIVILGKSERKQERALTLLP